MPESNTTSSERRRHPRYEILAQVRFRHADTNHVLDVANISASGLFVRVTSEAMLRRVEAGERLELDLSTERELVNIRVKARVVRIVGGGEARGWGFGLEFADLDPPVRRAVDRLVAEAASGSLTPPPLPTAREPFVMLPPTYAKDDEPRRDR
ncbi:MAG: PilZ domain-containing protein [Deltaproteobacteria bacterium]|nr:PilZ domain-containing protein [Deltaproteobacteria bacterium]